MELILQKQEFNIKRLNFVTDEFFQSGDTGMPGKKIIRFSQQKWSRIVPNYLLKSLRGIAFLVINFSWISKLKCDTGIPGKK